jgi:hypothetical protein
VVEERSDDTTGQRSRYRDHPEGMTDIESFPIENVQAFSIYDPFTIEWHEERQVSVGVASLNPRLFSVISPRFANLHLQRL